MGTFICYHGADLGDSPVLTPPELYLAYTWLSSLARLCVGVTPPPMCCFHAFIHGGSTSTAGLGCPNLSCLNLSCPNMCCLNPDQSDRYSASCQRTEGGQTYSGRLELFPIRYLRGGGLGFLHGHIILFISQGRWKAFVSHQERLHFHQALWPFIDFTQYLFPKSSSPPQYSNGSPLTNLLHQCSKSVTLTPIRLSGGGK